MKRYILLLTIVINTVVFAQDYKLIVDNRDKQEYKIVQIGSQWWTAENMRFKTNNNSWFYNNDSSRYNYLGRYYTFESAKEACPSGWHLPSDEEWKKLEVELGLSKEEANENNLRGATEGGKLKLTGTEHWESPNIDASNSTKFSALGSGYRNANGDFSRKGKGISFWTSTETDKDMAWFRSLHNNRGDIHRGNYEKAFGYSVRCIKN